MQLRGWVYCDPAIFICVSGNYIERVVFVSPEKEGEQEYLHTC